MTSLPLIVNEDALHIQSKKTMFEWDRHNLGKIHAHEISQEEAEHALLNDPIPILEQEVEGELRYVYYGETSAGRLLAAVVTERGENLRVVTAYELNAKQRRDYHQRRAEQKEYDQEDT